jgi:predicted nicotinamide N-methyase
MMADKDDPLVQESVEEDDWNLALDFHMFAQHESHSIYINSARDFQIECVEALTPLDMMNLSSGTHDATGHCVWMGAFLLIAAIDRLKEVFRGARVIELGCGTGIGGIALLLSGESSAPSFLSFTDSDPNALALCGRNCQSNLGEYQYQLEDVGWGTPLPVNVSPNSFDVVVAADVLYDIGCLSPLLTTAKECLKEGGHFVVSHVPRACFNTDHPPVESLEEYIVLQAKGYGFQLESILRPNDIAASTSAVHQEAASMKNVLNNVSLHEMQEVGAAVLVFRRT